MECSICGASAVYEVKYNGSALCKKHFLEYVEKRVKREIRNQVDFNKKNMKISVAISGGKDSSATLFLLHKILSERRNLELTAFTVDEGIEGYRSTGLEKAKKLCKNLGIPHGVISYKENFGYTLDEIMKIDKKTISCSHCGPMRRQLMNKISEYTGSDYVALGINLDDYAQSILMNVAKGDVARYARMAPHTYTREGLVPRILPLRKIPEKEVVLYAILSGIDFDSSWCPYYSMAQRNSFREIVEKLEKETPGTKFAIVKFFDETRPAIKDNYIKENTVLNKCRICGAPTPGDICEVCNDLEQIRKIEKEL
ncbi:TIGR00269 family protein [Ferroplasma sp.]|uniref:TIGR00269 family protein n=1 Tax=Ferroplasma sp. TaxID=2591003 RepID=UPI00307EE45B